MMLHRLRAATGGGPRFWGFLGLTVLSAALQAAAVLVLFPLIANLAGGHPADAWPWVVAMLLLIAAAWASDVAAARLGLALGIAVMRAIHRLAPEAILAWPSTRLTHERTASLRRLVAQGATEATSSVVLLIVPVVSAVVFSIALGAGLLTVSVPVALVTVAGGLLALAALWAGTRIESAAEKRYTRANEELDNRLFEFAWAQPSLRTSRATATGRTRVEDAIGSARRQALRLLLWQIPGEFLFSLVLQLVLLAYGITAWVVWAHGSIAPVTAAALVVVVLRVVEQIVTLSGSTTGVAAVNRTLSEVHDVMLTRQVVPAAPQDAAPRVAVRNACVVYPDGTTGLDAVDLDLAPGTVTVVVGRSGSGKTTLLRMLAGLVVPTSGKLSLDSREAETSDLRGNATVAFQNTELREGTVRENLLAVDPNLTDTDLDRLAEAAQLTEVLERPEHGWDTPVGELGSRLSGGERQRVGLARALAKPARLLLVDEATSALDARNERAVVEALARGRREYTTLVVTHRPAMLEIADRVVVMDRGRVVEDGTPAELAKAGGRFARMLDEWKAAAAWRV